MQLSFSKSAALIGHDPKTVELFKRIMGIARIGDNPVLVRGETGTGKEGIARAIHHNGPRANKKLIVVNCAAVSESLAESEWFGHVKGSFTGADKEKTGIFEEAHLGTVFLDEVGDLSAANQAKLLRVLQEMEVRKVGGTKTIKVDFRVVAATNKDLKDLVAKGEFRRDLYYRRARSSRFLP